MFIIRKQTAIFQRGEGWSMIISDNASEQQAAEEGAWLDSDEAQVDQPDLEWHQNETSGICANGLFDRKYLAFRASVWR